MEMANDLLARQKCIVTDVVDRDDSTRCDPCSTNKSEFTCRAPGFAFDAPAWFAKERLLGRVE